MKELIRERADTYQLIRIKRRGGMALSEGTALIRRRVNTRVDT